MNKNKLYTWSLWISTIIVILLIAVQGISGNWITFFLLWPGGKFSDAFLQAMMTLGSFHKAAGFIEGGISILILIFAFLSRSSIYTRIFAALGVAMMVLAAWGGVLYVTSSFQDRMALGQMADASVGALGVYLIQLFFMNRTPRFPWDHRHPG
jgi:hypothetical protein